MRYYLLAIISCIMTIISVSSVYGITDLEEFLDELDMLDDDDLAILADDDDGDEEEVLDEQGSTEVTTFYPEEMRGDTGEPECSRDNWSWLCLSNRLAREVKRFLSKDAIYLTKNIVLERIAPTIYEYLDETDLSRDLSHETLEATSWNIIKDFITTRKVRFLSNVFNGVDTTIQYLTGGDGDYIQFKLEGPDVTSSVEEGRAKMKKDKGGKGGGGGEGGNGDGGGGGGGSGSKNKKKGASKASASDKNKKKVLDKKIAKAKLKKIKLLKLKAKIKAKLKKKIKIKEKGKKKDYLLVALAGASIMKSKMALLIAKKALLLSLLALGAIIMMKKGGDSGGKGKGGDGCCPCVSVLKVPAVKHGGGHDDHHDYRRKKFKSTFG